jgi:hypothetical protein
MIRPEPDRHRHRVAEAHSQEARAGEQDERQADLRDDEAVPEALRCFTSGAAA